MTAASKKKLFKEVFHLVPLELFPESSSLPSDVIFLCNKAHKALLSNGRCDEILKIIQCVIDITWEGINTGHWSEVPTELRTLYGFASLIKVATLVKKYETSNEDRDEILKQAISSADYGLMLGANYHAQLSASARLLNSLVCSEWLNQEDPGKSSLSHKFSLLTFDDKSDDWEFGVRGNLVPSVDCPSLEYFSVHHFFPRAPVKITGCMKHWEALDKWKDVSYLLKQAGARTVPVEMGSKYTDSEWGMQLVTLEEFILTHISGNGPGKLGYLAQHQLFHQIPELKDDIKVPEYCCLSDTVDDEVDMDEPNVNINAWFGPKGTVTPLHFDPDHNLLGQVIGRKRVLLYPPEVSDHLYPFEDPMLNNTARVDPENPSNEFPSFKKVTTLECRLYPGEMLYIPPKWWHHVRALDVSFSVSFWWK